MPSKKNDVPLDEVTDLEDNDPNKSSSLSDPEEICLLKVTPREAALFDAVRQALAEETPDELADADDDAVVEEDAEDEDGGRLKHVFKSLNPEPLRLASMMVGSLRSKSPSPIRPDLIKAKLKPEVLVEPDSLAEHNRFLRRISLTAVSAATVAVCLTMVGASWSLSTPKQEEALPEGGDPLIELARFDGEIEAAMDIISQFHKAQNSEDRACYVLGGTAMIPKLNAYYEERSMAPSQIEAISRWDIVKVNERRHFAAQGVNEMGERLLAMVDLSGPEPKLNWEAMVGYSEISLDEFRAQKPQHLVTMRLLIRPDDYYNHAFNDEHHACFLLRENEATSSLHAYAPRSSEGYQHLRNLFQVIRRLSTPSQPFPGLPSEGTETTSSNHLDFHHGRYPASPCDAPALV